MSLPFDDMLGASPQPSTRAMTPAAERRWASRAATARLVRLEHQGGITFASCRDISDTGMWVDLGSVMELAGEVTVALSPNIAFSGHIVWLRGRECGVSFDRAIDCEALLASTGMELRAAKVAAESTARSRPMAPAMRWTDHREPQTRKPAPASGFRPGLGVTVMRAGGAEERTLVTMSGERGEIDR
jgi:hypothetical protein